MESTPEARKALLEQLLPLARAAGEIILDIYATEFAVRGKTDNSPVTEADEKAEAVILRGLAQLTNTMCDTITVWKRDSRFEGFEERMVCAVCAEGENFGQCALGCC